MPTKKLKPDAKLAKRPADAPEEDQRQGKQGASGLSGQGAESVLVHLKEQEKIRARKPGRS